MHSHRAAAATLAAQADGQKHSVASAKVPALVVHTAIPSSAAANARRKAIPEGLAWAFSPSGAVASVISPRADNLSASTVAAPVAPDNDRFEHRQPTPRGEIGGS